ncbi:MAG: DUF3604 domain-containing protein [Pseudomonadales bacterium]|nr:DUF3604 domain-containing protein [Pseudomonadales bacterium]
MPTKTPRPRRRFAPPNAIASALAALLTTTAGAAEGSYASTVPDAYPDTVYWGDTHVHTYLSGDAFGMGTRVTPEDAYRFAKGEEVVSTGGERVRLRRRLDFLMVADHAELLGILPRLVGGDERMLATEDGRTWARFFAEAPSVPDVLNAEDSEAFHNLGQSLMSGKAAWTGDFAIDDAVRREVWHAVTEAAERHNDPGSFTAFAGYEYSASMLHRNVLFAGGPEQTRQTLPFSGYDSDNPEDLWAHLAEYQTRTGSGVIAIPHNSNLSRGGTFSDRTFGGAAITAAYATLRAEREPVVEATQIKGDSETHPLASPDDPFADFETRAAYRRVQDDPSDAWVRGSYIRPALKRGLDFEAEVGANPFKFGLIGSTDSHTGLATADDDYYWGMLAAYEPNPYRALAQPDHTASGYAAVWAEANTRQALFAAFKRREVYATTGPRIVLRFFGGWDYTEADAARPDLAALGYRKGVPMGGDLTCPETPQAPRFLIRAVKDPDGANLDRVQVIKGWRDQEGTLHERIYDVAWSGNRNLRDGELEDVDSTVDIATATYLNSVGAAELAVTWTDPDFKADEVAFYYVRVLEIPTPRWTAYDAAFYGIGGLPETAPMVTRERAYSSPIWYTP